jgi:hypothetical protein
LQSLRGRITTYKVRNKIMAQRKAFTPLKINLTEIQDPEARQALEMKFMDYRIQRQLSIETQRKALISQQRAKAQESASQIALAELLMAAGQHFDEVQTEPIWFAYKSNGDIILESPFTERDMRVGIRLQRKQMNQAAEQLGENGGNDDLYEDDGEGSGE